MQKQETPLLLDNVETHQVPNLRPLSEPAKNFWKALASAKNEFKPILKKRTNPHFKSKYADLSDIHEAINESLLKHGFVVSEILFVEAKETTLTTRLIHFESGHEECSVMRIAAKDPDNPQAVGSGLTYARRQNLSALLSISTETDDDGNSGSKEKEKEKPAQKNAQQNLPNVKPAENKTAKYMAENPPPSPKEFEDEPGQKGTDVVTQKQVGRFWTIARTHGWTDDEVKDLIRPYGFDSTKQLTRFAYDALVGRLEKRAKPEAKNAGADTQGK